MLEQGIIRESCSDFSSPVVVCKKKDGTMRLCIDYRNLNKKIVKDRYPLPIIEEVLDKLGNGKIFTTLDLKNAFFHVDVDEASRKYTAFVTETGQYEFLKVPFGLSISSNYFQRNINYVFRELLRDGTLIIYLDDIIIPATDEKEACKKLARVLETASRYGIELNLKKSQFVQGKINFLGHVTQNGIIQLSAEKTVSVCNFPEPKNAKDVQSFLGLTGYFRKYIPSYAMLARPLSDLLTGTNPFEFGHAQKIAFQNLKNALCSEPVLHLFKEGANLELYTDACKLGLGSVLLQQGEDGRFYPIHYMSKKNSIQEEKLCSYELEVLAVIEALKKFRNYLLGRKFRIQTDCAAFAKNLDQKELTPKMARWSIFLTDFDYEVVHRPAKQMQHVDTLSRHPVMLVTGDELTYKIANAQESHEYIRTIKKLLQEGKTSELIVSNKILYKMSEDQELLVIPEMMQVVLNSVPSRSTNYSPFEKLIGVKMKNPEDVMIRNLIEESQEQLFQHRDNLRREAKQNILKIQEENRRTCNRKRKEAYLYKKGDLVAIMRTQFGNKLKLRIKYFGPYQVTKVKPHDRYDVAKIGDHEGPNVTSASADQMKPLTWH
ncbi:retrovirus-related Pol polyprotein from transposon 17.6 [Trichonephila clavipes]|nr:retrovirus-related Pol polyprotein from transposon 17.6 [Trichonephila clavipes]